jgi:phosphoacetylglucosamine mutase
LVDPLGEMLESSWEAYATLFANAKDEEALLDAIRKVVNSTKLDLNAKAVVIYARDTRYPRPPTPNPQPPQPLQRRPNSGRPSGVPLSESLADGLNAFEAETTDYGVQTTPQLHYLVRCLNTQGTNAPYGTPTEVGYYEKMATAFKQLMQGKKKQSRLTVDCANGVGAPKLAEFLKYVGDDHLEIRIVNADIHNPKKLNLQCGADYVKTQQKFPPGSVLAPLERWCSLDGDADRLMYYYVDTDGLVRLLDGDKIASLCAMFVMDLVKAAGVEIKVGVVQTAYANGNSTSYLSKVLVPPNCKRVLIGRKSPLVVRRLE